MTPARARHEPPVWLVALAVATRVTAVLAVLVASVTGAFPESWEQRTYLFAALVALPSGLLIGRRTVGAGTILLAGSLLTLLALAITPGPVGLAMAAATLAAEVVAIRRGGPALEDVARGAIGVAVVVGIPAYFRVALGLDRPEGLPEEILYPALPDPSESLLIAIAVAAAVTASFELLGRVRPGRWRGLLLLTVTVPAVAAATFTPQLPIREHEMSYILGPVVRLFDGGTAFVDTYSQYGLASLYAVVLALGVTGSSATFASLTFLTTIVSTAFVVGFVVLAWHVSERDLGATLVAAAGALLILVYVPVEFPASFPSTGLFRFGPVYALAAVAILRPRGRTLTMATALLLALAAVWSFDALTQVGFVTLALRAPELLRDRAAATRALRDTAGLALGAVAYGWATVAVAIRVASAQWPDPGPYLALLSTYVNGFGMLPMPAIGLWWILAVAYAGAALWAIARLSTSAAADDVPARQVLAVAAVGIAIFPYYVGRSHGNNLLHIAPPLLFLAAYAVARARQVARAPLRRATLICVTGAIAALGSWGAGDIAWKLPYSAIGVVAAGWPRPPLDAIGAAIRDTSEENSGPWRELVAPWAADATAARRVALLVPLERASGIAAAIGRANAATTGDPGQDELAWTALQPVIERELAQLGPGDLVVTATAVCRLTSAQRDLLAFIGAAYRLQVVRTAPFGPETDVVISRIVAGSGDAQARGPCPP